VACAAALAALLLALPGPASADPVTQAGRTTLRPRTVEAVQRKLVQLGYLPAGGVDGIFGGESRAAVIAFQKWKRLARDGIPGPVTQKALASAKRPTPRRKGPGTRIEILLDRQLLLFVRNGWVARTLHVSTGRRGFRTPAGDYAVLRKRRKSRSIPYKVWLPWASYFVRGVAIHQSKNVPVAPVSHGCVRVPVYDAVWLFRRTPVGTPVTVLKKS
jgi:hypothetical protein